MVINGIQLLSLSPEGIGQMSGNISSLWPILRLILGPGQPEAIGQMSGNLSSLCLANIKIDPRTRSA